MAEDDQLARLRRGILDTFRPLLDPNLPAALVDYPDSRNCGDHAIWLGEKALFDALRIKTAYQCSVATYDKSKMAAAVGAGPVFMHGGGNFGDIYPLYHDFRLQILKDFPHNRIVVFPQTAMFFSDSALQSSVEAFARHGNVTLAARDVLSRHILDKSFGSAARVVLAPDMAFMLGPQQRTCAPAFDVVWINRTDREGVYGSNLAASAGLPPLQQVQADLGVFDDGLATVATAAIAGSQLLISDWYQMSVPTEKGLDAYERHSFQKRSRFWVERALRLLCSGRVVVSDRLHCHILCTLAGIPHVLLNNNYGKNFSFFESWSRPSRLCRLAPTSAAAWSLAQQFLALSPAPKTSL